jgi:hypothetical protein
MVFFTASVSAQDALLKGGFGNLIAQQLIAHPNNGFNFTIQNFPYFLLH